MYFFIILRKEMRLLTIKEKREQLGITQAELAKEMGVDQSAVCLWETGKTCPRGKLLPRLAGLLKCSIDELMKADESAAIPENPGVSDAH